MRIDFHADPGLYSEGGRRAQRWSAVDADTGGPASARHVFAALAAEEEDDGDAGTNPASRALLSALQSCPFDAAYWECPPLIPTDLDGVGFEFVLVDAPELLASVAGGYVYMSIE
jgi:hypothetical protein